jgi:hypothetical protein
VTSPASDGNGFHALADDAIREGRFAELGELLRKIAPRWCDQLQAAATDSLRAREQGLDAEGPRLARLGELLARPELLEAPRAVAPKLAWEGRTTLLAAREKTGKSTAGSAAVAAVSAGLGLFGGPTLRAPVLLLSLEEHLGDVARRLQAFGAEPETVWILDRVEDPLGDLAGAVQQVGPALVVIDTLAAFTAPLALDPGNASAWTPIMSGLSRVARDSGAALLLLHHASKADGSYRDSTAIGAGVDVILEAKRGPDETIHVKARGRFPVEDFSLRLLGTEDHPRLALAAGELGLDARILFYVDRHPGASRRQVREAVEGRTKDIGDTIDLLLGRGVLDDRGEDRRSELYSTAQDAAGTRAEPPGTAPGTAGTGQGGGGGSRGGATPVGGAPREPPAEPVGDLDEFDSAIGWPR